MKFVSVYICLTVLFALSTAMELYRSEKENLYIVDLTNREKGEHCSSMSRFSSFFFLLARSPFSHDVVKEREENPVDVVSSFSNRHVCVRVLNEREPI